MSNKNRAWRLGLAAALMGAAALTAGAWAQAGKSRGTGAEKSEPAAGGKDVIIFKNGRIVEGRIISETDTAVVFKVQTPLGEADATYSKSEILSIERGKKAEGVEAPKDGKSDTKAAPVIARPGEKTGPGGVDAQTVYMVEIKGEFGRDFTRTPLRQMMADAKRIQPDIIIFKVNTDFKVFGQEREEYNPADANAAFNQLETVRELQTMITDGIRDDEDWVKKPRIVSWVRRAQGGVAFLPFVTPEIYYTSDALHGGIGYLEFIFGGTGDADVREKQYSLRLARAEGLAIKGGHDERIIKAMSRADYVLSYKMEGGTPVFFERMPEGADEILLTDDASESEGRRDTIQDVARFKGDDVLTLRADLAFRLGVSKGTTDTLEELMDLMGVSRNYKLVNDRGDKILKDWGAQVSKAELDFRRLWREFGRVQVQPPAQYRERTEARGRQKNLLQQVLSLLRRYGEAINPYEIEGFPDDWETNINLMIERIDQQQRLDRRE